MTTIRKALATASPHVSLKNAWRAAIHHSRRQRREGVERTSLSRAQVDRFLEQPVPSDRDIETLKVALSGVLQNDNEGTLTQALNVVEDWINHAGCTRVTDSAVALNISLEDERICKEDIDRWLGTSGGTIEVSAQEASRWMHHLNGRNIAGTTLTVHARPLDGLPLPSIDRRARGRVRTTGHKIWLPHLDEVGHYSATPRSIAEAHALELKTCSAVIDPFCGAGADAIAVAMSGPMVLASDISASRLQLARSNAEHFGVTESIRFTQSEAEAAIAGALKEHQNLGLFLDPPWGGTDWDRDSISPTKLFHLLPNIESVICRFEVVVIKLPRTFPIQSLGRFGGRWEFKLGIDSKMVDPVDQVKTVIAIRHRLG